MITVKYFAALKGIAGKEQDHFDLGAETTLAELCAAIEQTQPQIGEMIRQKKTLVSVNLDMAPLDSIVRDGDEVALLPPFSGGAGPEFLPSER